MTEIIAGAEPWSHEGDVPHGVLVLHGFTGNPDSMRELAEAFAVDGFHVEMPLLPGHGTVVEEMIPTRWSDWHGAAEQAFDSLAARCSKLVVAGLSMGGSLALRLGADHPDIVGLVCINPATIPLAAEMVEPARAALLGGIELMDALGSDIADPDVTEKAYPATPLAPLISLVEDGLIPLADEYPTMHIPLLLLNAPQDHVVDPIQSDYLAEHYGGQVERVTLERSYHVATQDFDKQLIFERAVAFARAVAVAP
jgi:carboxylesterase